MCPHFARSASLTPGGCSGVTEFVFDGREHASTISGEPQYVARRKPPDDNHSRSPLDKGASDSPQSPPNPRRSGRVP